MCDTPTLNAASFARRCAGERHVLHGVRDAAAHADAEGRLVSTENSIRGGGDRAQQRPWQCPMTLRRSFCAASPNSDEFNCPFSWTSRVEEEHHGELHLADLLVDLLHEVDDEVHHKHNV